MNPEIHPSPERPVLPIEEGIELRLLGPSNENEVYDAVLKNQAHLKPWVFWAGDSFGRDVVAKMLAENEAGFQNGTAYAMGIYENGRLIGSTDIRGIGSAQGAEIGYWVAEDATGKGLATKATAALIEYAQAHHKIPKIVLHTMVDNKASSRVAEKLGFHFDGLVHNDEYDIEEKRYVRNYE